MSRPSPARHQQHRLQRQRQRRLSPPRVSRISEREVLFFAMFLCSLSLFASHWAYRAGQRQQQMQYEAAMKHIMNGTTVTATLRSSEAPPQQQEQADLQQRPRKKGLILDLGVPPNAPLSEALEDVTLASAALTTKKKEEKQISHSDATMKEKAVVEKQAASVEELSTTGEHESAAVVWNQRPAGEAAFPIINVGLPRSGEDTLWNFFHNLGLDTQYGCGDMKKPRPGCTSLGACVQTNVQQGRPALSNCSQRSDGGNNSPFQVFTQLDQMRYLIRTKPVKTGQILPQIAYLEELYQYAPNATWILPLHLSDHWAYTVSRHRMLRKRLWHEVALAKHGSVKLPLRDRSVLSPELGEVDAVAHWQNYYEEHTQRIREFAKAHPSLRVIELHYRLDSAPSDLLQSLHLPQSATTPKNATDAWQCMRNECDLWDDNLEIIERVKETPRPTITLPKPIFVVGFPKSGTTSVFNFFSCAGAVSQHYCCCGDVSDHRPCYSQVMADCILENKENGRPMLEGCGEYDLYAQLDGEHTTVLDGNDRRAGHYLPQVAELDWIHQEYPNATFILPLRESEEWAHSVNRWFNMRHRIQTEYVLMNRSADVQDVGKPLVNIYDLHTQNVMDFVRRHPSHKLIKFHITQPDAGKILADASGLPESCWGHHNKNTRPKKY